MKHILFIVSIFSAISVSAQCSLRWERAEEDSVTIIEQRPAVNYIMGPDGYKLSKKILDSMVGVVSYQLHPHYINKDSSKIQYNDDSADSDAVRQSDGFRVFHINGKDIVHYASHKYLLGSDSIEVHQFEYCDHEWNEDFYQNRVFYTTLFGAIFESQGLAGDPVSIYYHLRNNICLSTEQNEKVQRLLNEMDRN